MAVTSKARVQTSGKEQPAKRQPDFNIRAKVREETRDGTKVKWVTIGVMWSADLGNGKKGWSLKINSLPPGWNGDGLAMPPLPPGEPEPEVE